MPRSGNYIIPCEGMNSGYLDNDSSGSRMDRVTIELTVTNFGTVLQTDLTPCGLSPITIIQVDQFTVTGDLHCRMSYRRAGHEEVEIRLHDTLLVVACYLSRGNQARLLSR